MEKYLELLEEFLVDYLADFHDGANYTLLREE